MLLSSIGYPWLCLCVGTIYMFGGWDGTNDLCDLWQFSVELLQWKCLCADTSLEVDIWYIDTSGGRVYRHLT